MAGPETDNSLHPEEIQDFILPYQGSDDFEKAWSDFINYPQDPSGPIVLVTSCLDAPQEPSLPDSYSISDASDRARASTATAEPLLSSNLSYTSAVVSEDHTSPDINSSETERIGGNRSTQGAKRPFPESDLQDSLRHVGGAAIAQGSDGPGSSHMLDVPSVRSRPGTPTRERSPLGSKRPKVARMRDKRACVRCHIRRVECDEEGPCGECDKYLKKTLGAGHLSDGYHAQICTRQRLAEVRFSSHLPTSDMPPRDTIEFVGPVYPAEVTFHEVGEPQPVLMLNLQQFVVNRQMRRPEPTARAGAGAIQYGLQREQVPSYTAFLRWSEDQISRDGKATFQNAVGSFLSAYASRRADLARQDLVRKTHELRCWYRIWQSPVLFVKSSLGAGRLAAITHLEIKSIAISAVKSLERDILTQLDDLLRDDIKGNDTPTWACFWQLILLYRQLKWLCDGTLQNTHSSGWSCNTLELPPAAFDTLTQLHDLLVGRYAAYFRRTSPVYEVEASRATSLGGDARLLEEFDNVCRLRKIFQTLPFDDSDLCLKALIVDREIDLDQRRSRNRRKT